MKRMFVLLLLTLVGIAGAQDSLNVREIGHLYNEWHSANTFAIQGDYSFVAGGYWSDLRILRISNPDSIQEVAFFRAEMRRPISTIAVQNGTMLISAAGERCYILDVSDPIAPEVVGNIEIDWQDGFGNSIYVFFYGDRAFICRSGRNQSLLSLFDISDPVNPAEISRRVVPGKVSQLVLQDTVAYIAQGSSGLRLVGLADPNLEDIGHVAVDSLRRIELVARGDTIIAISDGSSKIWLLDADNLETISQIVLQRFRSGKMEFSGTKLYLETNLDNDYSDGMFLVIDISDPVNPVVVNQNSCHWPVDFALDENEIVWLLSEEDLAAKDYSNPEEVREIGRYVGRDKSIGNVSLTSSLALVAGGYGGLRIVDISNPANMREIGVFDPDTMGPVINIVPYRDDYALISDYMTGLRVVDISDPTQPEQVGVLPRGGMSGLGVMDNYAVIATNDGLVIADLTDPMNPSQAGFYPINSSDVAIPEGQDIALVVGSSQLHVVDLARPRSPQLVASCITGGRSIGIAARGNLVCLANRDSGLVIVNITDLEHPTVVSTLPIGDAIGVEIVGDRAVVMEYFYGLHVVDISNPANPREVGFYETPGWACRVAASGDTAFVADFFSLRSYDISEAVLKATNQSNLQPKSTLLFPAYPNPFNSSTTIRYELSVPGQVNVSLLDPYGREVKRLLYGFRLPGDYSVNIDAADLPSGAYFIRLETTSQNFTKQVQLLR